MKIYFIWLIGVIIWNFGYPEADPTWDVFAAIILSFLSFILKKYPIHLNHLIIGFVVGTLPIVWPWNKVELGAEIVNIFNNFYGLIFILASFIIIVFLNKNVDKKNIRTNR